MVIKRVPSCIRFQKGITPCRRGEKMCWSLAVYRTFNLGVYRQGQSQEECPPTEETRNVDSL